MKLEFNYRYADIGKVFIHVRDTNFEWTLTHRTLKRQTKVGHSQNIKAFNDYSLKNLLNEL